MAPPSQRYRNIGFLLEGGQGEDIKLDLAIRPEDLTVSEPSRLVVQQTIGGAWADSFGRGQVSITLGGTLGWRGGLFSSGEDAFLELRQTVFTEWHLRREDQISSGNDPEEVRLTFVDTLDSLTYIVAPQQFTLRRSKSSPLLSRYQIRLLVLEEADAPNDLLDQISAALNNPLRWIAGLTGLGGILKTLQKYYTLGMNLWGAASAAVRGLLATGIGLLQAVQSVAAKFRGVFSGGNSGLLTTALAFTRAASNALDALTGDDTLPIADRLPALRLASTFNDANCTLANSFSRGSQFTTYEDLFGASACSSTGGGEPISIFTAKGENPFETLFPITLGGITVSTEAAAALSNLARADPLLLVGRDAAVVDSLNRIAAGVRVPIIADSAP